MDNEKQIEVREISNLTAVLDIQDENLNLSDEFKKLPIYSDEKASEYIQSFRTSEKPDSLSYTYGGRVNLWKKYITDLLKHNPNTKRAYIPIFHCSDHKLQNKPCAVGCSFLIRNDMLNMTIFFRSHDIYRGWPINIIGFHDFSKTNCK